MLLKDLPCITFQTPVAGSFGHFQASKSGVHKGGLSQPIVKAGFVATRISVSSSISVAFALYLSQS